MVYQHAGKPHIDAEETRARFNSPLSMHKCPYAAVAVYHSQPLEFGCMQCMMTKLCVFKLLCIAYRPDEQGCDYTVPDDKQPRVAKYEAWQHRPCWPRCLTTLQEPPVASTSPTNSNPHSSTTLLSACLRTRHGSNQTSLLLKPPPLPQREHVVSLPQRQ